jgi:hypothetical protein
VPSGLQCKTYKDKRGAGQLTLAGMDTERQKPLMCVVSSISRAENVLNLALACTNFYRLAINQEDAELRPKKKKKEVSRILPCTRSARISSPPLKIAPRGVALHLKRLVGHWPSGGLASWD